MKLLYAEDERPWPRRWRISSPIITIHHYLVDRVADGEEALAYGPDGGL